jgi:iron complex transport system substrate-binding protein
VNISPQRIVCLSAETADWLWRVGAWDKVAGVTAYFRQPENVPPKPRVSGFSSANLEQIEKLQPDLVITFSDVQTKLADELNRRGFEVLRTDQRPLAEVEDTLTLLARVVNREHEGEKWLREFRQRLTPVENISKRPRVYFEEWNEPFVSGIAWVSELIERAGGQDIFADLRTKRAAKERVVSSEQICAANPEIIFASWCGQPVNVTEISARSGWQNIRAIRNQRIYEIPGDDILQPGFRLVYGFERIRQVVQR